MENTVCVHTKLVQHAPGSQKVATEACQQQSGEQFVVFPYHGIKGHRRLKRPSTPSKVASYKGHVVVHCISVKVQNGQLQRGKIGHSGGGGANGALL